MSLHDDHASCPQCRMAAGEYYLDIGIPCNICGGWTSMGETQEVLGGRQSEGQPARETALVCSLPSTRSVDFVRTSIGLKLRAYFRNLFPGGEDDFEDNLLVSMPSPLVQQILVVQAQNGVNMASGTATTAPSTVTTASSTAPLPLVAGPCTMESLIPIDAQLGGQDMPSVNQGARPAISTEQTVHVYSEIRHPAVLPYTAPLPSTAPLPYAAMPAMLARSSFPMGYYGQGNRFPLMPNPNRMSVREQCYNTSSFRNGSSLKLGELAKPSLGLSPPLVLRGFQLRLRTMLRSFQ